jgi:phosphatidylserine/phosphatidylglycerophosphate/cardiolipin synthase-like enzyme
MTSILAGATNGRLGQTNDLLHLATPPTVNSCELNYENNILFCDSSLTAAVRERQHQYLATSNRITREIVDAWPMRRRLWNNSLAVLSPIL